VSTDYPINTSATGSIVSLVYVMTGFPCKGEVWFKLLSLVNLTSMIIWRLKVQYFADVITSFSVDRFYEDRQFRVRILLEGLRKKK